MMIIQRLEYAYASFPLQLCASLCCRQKQILKSHQHWAAIKANNFVESKSILQRKFLNTIRSSMDTGVAVVQAQKQQSEVQAMPIHINSKPNIELMIVSDLDFTMVDHDDPSHESLLRFNSLWNSEYSHNSCLVFSSGRSPARYEDLKRLAPLLTPCIAVLSVGTEIYYGKSMQPDSEWLQLLDHGWDRELILREANAFPQLELQEDIDQRPHKISFNLKKEDALEVQQLLLHKLEQHGLQVKFIYSSGTAFDVLPKMGGKGQALSYLIRKLRDENWRLENILVCGDSGNDIDLFQTDGTKGVIVFNAHEELLRWYRSQNSASIYHSTERCATAIMEAIKYFNLGPHLSPRERMISHDFVSEDYGQKKLCTDGSAKREVIEFNIFVELWLSGYFSNNDELYKRVADVIAENATMVYPWGKEFMLKESLDSIREKHGLMKGKCFLTWIDNIREIKLGNEAYLVTWESWAKLEGEEAKGYYATAVLLPKDKTPNGVTWVRVHETSRNIK